MTYKKEIKGKSGRRFSFEWIIFKDSSDKDELGQISAEMTAVAISSGQNPRNGASDWVGQADGILLVRLGEELVGFCCFAFPRHRFIYVIALMVSPDYQGEGLAGRGIRLLVLHYIKNKAFIWYKPWGFLENFYLLFRTQNPNTYHMLSRRFKIYPPLMTEMSNRNVPSKALSFLKQFARKTWPHASFDDKDFVLRDAYIVNPSLSIAPTEVPWTSDEKVNNLFKEKIGLGKATLDSLVVLAELNIVSLLKSLIKK